MIRGGKPIRVPGRELVRGDIIILSEGDRVPADARVLSSTNLSIDESLLTGESVPVRKTANAVPVKTVSPGGDDLPFVYSGTLVVQGRGEAEVEAIGLHTEIGKIGRALQSVPLERTHRHPRRRNRRRSIPALSASLCAPLKPA